MRAPVYPDGNVCISILHTPGDDPTMYEKASERWSPVQSVEKVILSVVSMLARRSPSLSAFLRRPFDTVPGRTQPRKWRQHRLLQIVPGEQGRTSLRCPDGSRLSYCVFVFVFPRIGICSNNQSFYSRATWFVNGTGRKRTWHRIPGVVHVWPSRSGDIPPTRLGLMTDF